MTPRWNIAERYGLVPGRGVCVFDPLSLTAGLTAAIGGIAAGTADVAAGGAALAGTAAAAGSGISATTALAAGSSALTLVGGGISAASTLAGGNYAAEAGTMQKAASEYQAEQLDQNATQAIASGQRKAMDTALRTKLAIGSSVARAAGSGFDAGVGSPVTNESELAQRGSYQALMEMFNGESEATGIENQATGVRYGGDLAEFEGKTKQSASKLAALGTLAGSAGGALSTFGKLAYPTTRGGAGASI